MSSPGRACGQSSYHDVTENAGNVVMKCHNLSMAMCEESPRCPDGPTFFHQDRTLRRGDEDDWFCDRLVIKMNEIEEGPEPVT